MNDTIISVAGIHLSQETIQLEDSTDTATIIKVKDEHGGLVSITITFGKITNIDTWTK